MGRGVNYLAHAQEVTYFPFEGGYSQPLDDDGNEIEVAEPEFDQDLNDMNWEDLKCNLVAVLKKAFPSLSEPGGSPLGQRRDKNPTGEQPCRNRTVRVLRSVLAFHTAAV